MDDLTQILDGIRLCAECRRLGGCRLGLSREVLGDDGVLTADLICSAAHEGGPGVAHGGWTAAVMDEILGHIAPHQGRISVTATLTVDFLRPVPIDRPLIGVAWIEREENGRLYNRGELRLAATGAVLARAHGSWALRTREHFKKFQEWMKTEDKKASGH